MKLLRIPQEYEYVCATCGLLVRGEVATVLVQLKVQVLVKFACHKCNDVGYLRCDDVIELEDPPPALLNHIANDTA